MHEALIVLHAVCAVGAFALGFAALRWRVVAGAYVVLLAGMLVFVAAAVVTAWPGLDTGVRAVFSALLVLGAYAVFRSARAWRTPRAAPGAPVQRRRPGRIRDVGFTLITLAEGFALVLLIDLGAAVWLVAVVGVVIVVAGHLAVLRAEARSVRGAMRVA